MMLIGYVSINMENQS